MKNIFLESHNIDNLHFGFGQYNYHLIKGFYEHKAFHEFDFTLNAKNHKALEKEFGNDFTYKKYSSLQRHPALRIKKKYNLWHSMNQNTKVEPFFDTPYIMTVHDVNFMEESTPDVLEKKTQQFKSKMNRSNALVYISNYAKAMTHRYFEIPDIPEHVIYNGNPIQSITIPENHRPAVVPKHPFIFFVGEFQERKNIHAMVAMLQHLPDVSLVLAGKNTSSYAADIRDYITKNHLEYRVLLPGKISELDKYYYYENCLAFGFPSLREGFGIPPIEAMTFGKPVFLSTQSSLPEIGGKYAFYWKNFDPQSMATVFTKSMQMYSRNIPEYSQNYKAHAHTFDWATTAQQYLEVYRSVLG